MKYALLLTGFTLALAGCKSSDQRGIEDMVRDRLGPLATVSSISDAVIYRQGDVKRSCVIVTYSNQWGEEMPRIMIDGWYNFVNGTWTTDNPHEIDADFSCEQHAAELGQILDE